MGSQLRSLHGGPRASGVCFQGRREEAIQITLPPALPPWPAAFPLLSSQQQAMPSEWICLALGEPGVALASAARSSGRCPPASVPGGCSGCPAWRGARRLRAWAWFPEYTRTLRQLAVSELYVVYIRGYMHLQDLGAGKPGVVVSGPGTLSSLQELQIHPFALLALGR